MLIKHSKESCEYGWHINEHWIAFVYISTSKPMLLRIAMQLSNLISSVPNPIPFSTCFAWLNRSFTTSTMSPLLPYILKKIFFSFLINWFGPLINWRSTSTMWKRIVKCCCGINFVIPLNSCPHFEIGPFSVFTGRLEFAMCTIGHAPLCLICLNLLIVEVFMGL